MEKKRPNSRGDPPALSWEEMLRRIRDNYDNYDDDGEAVRKKIDDEEDDADASVRA